MNAADARTLTEARKMESWVDYTMRAVIMPGIELAAGQGMESVAIHLRPVWQACWDNGEWEGRLDRLTDLLERQGYKVMMIHPAPASSRVDVEVRVSW